MKKITLGIIAAIASINFGYSQVNLNVIAPPADGTTTQLRAPNGNSIHAVMRGCFLVTPSELSALSTGSVISTFGFSLALGTQFTSVTGSFNLYFQNTTNTTYQKGTNWTTALTGMTQAYSGNMTVPAVNSSTTILLSLAPGFNYTGGGLYVAYDWSSAGPYDANVATYASNTSLQPGGATIDATVAPAPNILGTTNFRPVFLFSAANMASNDLSVVGINAAGKVASLFGNQQVVTAEVMNGSNVALNNIIVGLGVTGANTFINTQSIASLAPGAVQQVTFAPYTSTNLGANNLSVTVSPDQNNNNNMLVWTQSVICDQASLNPPTAANTYSALGLGFGANNSGIYSFKYTPVAAGGSLTAVRVAVPSFTQNLGKQTYAVLMDNGGNIVATGNTITLAGANFNTFVNYPFATPVPLTAGSDYYIGLGIPQSATFPIGTIVAPWAIDGYYSSPIAGGAAPAPFDPGYMSIEAVFSFTNTTIAAAVSKTVICRGESVTLNVTGGSTTYTWSANAAGSNSTSVVASPTTNATYTVQGTNAGCKSNVASVTVSVSTCTGLLANGTIGSEIRVYPNPAVNGKSMITGLDGTNKIVVFNILGQVVTTLTSSDNAVAIDLANQPNGTYLVKITDSTNNSKTVKVVNQN